MVYAVYAEETGTTYNTASATPRSTTGSATRGCSATRGALLAVSLCAAFVLLSNQTHIQAELTSAAVHTRTQLDPRSRPPPTATKSEDRRRVPHQPVSELSDVQPAPTPASTPAPTPAAASRPRGLATFPPPPNSLTLVFGNSEMADFVYNWLAHARRVPGLAPYSAVALDDGLVAKCTAMLKAAAQRPQPPNGFTAAQKFHSHPEPSASSPSSEPRQRQSKLGAASSLGQP